MVNREYIKTQIDKLPDEIVISVGNYINKKIKLNSKKTERNQNYIDKIDRSFKELEKGKTVTFETEELDAMLTMTPEETKELIKKARARGSAE